MGDYPGRDNGKWRNLLLWPFVSWGGIKKVREEEGRRGKKKNEVQKTHGHMGFREQIPFDSHLTIRIKRGGGGKATTSIKWLWSQVMGVSHQCDIENDLPDD